jgi:CBS domain-containing protein
MNVAEIMTTPVITVTPEANVAEAARLMLEHRVSGLPVVNPAGAVVGVVSESDLLHRAETGTERRRSGWLRFLADRGQLADEYAHSHARKVGEVMTPVVVSVAPTAPLADAVGLMESRNVKRLPVIDGGRLVGIISRANVVRALLQSLSQEAPKPGPVADAEIRASILAEIAKQPWTPRASLDVRVADGVAALHGSIGDERERLALRVLAENTTGVKEVRDHLIWVEPHSGYVIRS